MSPSPRLRIVAGATLVALLGAGAGFGLAQLGKPPAAARAASAGAPGQGKILYWYDPMVPEQHFDHPGLSPMGMQMIPRYAQAQEGGGAGQGAGVQVSGAAQQALGMRLARVRRGALPAQVDADGVLDFDGREVAVVQARSAGFVERVYGRAPGDVVAARAPIADLLIPAWGGAEAEFLAVRRQGDPTLTAAARQRLRLLGIPEAVIDAVQRSGRPHAVVTVSSPISGAIQTLDVRAGMSVAAGQTLAQINGLATVWLDAAVPEAQAGLVKAGEAARADLAAFPGRTFGGRVSAILPSAQTASRTLTVRVELPNRGGLLRPGMFATAHFTGAAQPALLVPSEAVITTGSKSVVMAAGADGRYRPVEVAVGRQWGDETQILAGLTEGEEVVASGEFLIDSEASLAGIQAQALGTPK